MAIADERILCPQASMGSGSNFFNNLAFSSGGRFDIGIIPSANCLYCRRIEESVSSSLIRRGAQVAHHQNVSAVSAYFGLFILNQACIRWRRPLVCLDTKTDEDSRLLSTVSVVCKSSLTFCRVK